MSLQSAQREYDLREPALDAVRSYHRERIADLLSDLNAEIEALCDLDDIPCDRVTVDDVLEIARG